MSPAKIILMYMKRYVSSSQRLFSAGRHLLLTEILVRSRVSAGAFTLLLFVFFFLLVRSSENMFSPKTQVFVKYFLCILGSIRYQISWLIPLILILIEQ